MDELTHSDARFYHRKGVNEVDMGNLMYGGGTFPLPDSVHYCVEEAITAEANTFDDREQDTLERKMESEVERV